MTDLVTPTSRQRGDLGLTFGQIRYQNRIFWRTPISAFFTIVFPLMFLIVFTAVFGNDTIDDLGITTAQFYAPALAVFAAASATYTNLSVTTAIARDNGILKRVRGTPLPPWIYMTGRVGSAIWLALLAVLIMMTVGVVVYDIEIFPEKLPAAGVSFLFGVACFAALGLMLAALVKNGDAAPAVANATLLPLAFVSNIFLVPTESRPGWIEFIGNVFPLKHFSESFSGAFNPLLEGNGFQWSGGDGEYAIGQDLAVMAVWGVVAIVLTLRYFQWEPRGGESPTKGRRRRRRSRRRG
jgi:ABC-2 type transport system permease protein